MVEIKDTSLYDELNGKIETLSKIILRDEYYGMLESTYTSYVRTKKSYEEFMDNGNMDAARTSLELIKENYVVALKYGIDKTDIRPLLAYYNEKFKEVYPDKDLKINKSTKNNVASPFADLDALMADIDKKIAELDAEEEARKKKEDNKK